MTCIPRKLSAVPPLLLSAPDEVIEWRRRDFITLIDQV
jgi:hypothetical protein